VAPDDAKERYEHSVEFRKVVGEPNTDGPADLYATNLPVHSVQAATRRLTKLARARKQAGDERSMDQLRADILLDLLDGTADGTGTGEGFVHLTVDLATLAGLAEHPGELAGLGPVIADIARKVAQQQRQANWWWTATDPTTGLPIHIGTTRRRPTTMQRRRVAARNPICVHPGCRMPAFDCDIDHRIPHSESHQTRVEDLAPLCRHHHILKDQHGWSYRPLPDGDWLFTTPPGHKHTTSGRDP
jgi:hypothetical protein